MNNVPRLDSQLAEPFKRMTADIETAFTFFGGIECLRDWLTERLLDDRAIASDSGAPCLHRNARWRSEAMRLLSQPIEPQSLFLSDAVQTAFGNADPLVRGIAWRLLMEARAEPQFSVTVDSMVGDEFARRLPKGAMEDDHIRLARSFLIAVRGSVATFRGRAFCHSLAIEYLEGKCDADTPPVGGLLQDRDPTCRIAALRGRAGAANRAADDSVMIAQMIFADPDPEVRLPPFRRMRTCSRALRSRHACAC
jgi:hypothetical protein